MSEPESINGPQLIAPPPVLSIPVLLLWNRHTPLRKKLILFGVFSITVIVMAVSIIRVAVSGSPNQIPDMSWLYFWSFIEMGTGRCFIFLSRGP
jgi:hypothetical protein